MKKGLLFTFCAFVALSGCARFEERGPRYDPHACPLCLVKPGECGYCHGDGKCSFCEGTGVRKTSTHAMTEDNIAAVTYEEKCPYCHGSGTCWYCEGKGKCWSCDGSGTVKEWDMLKAPKTEKK